MRDIAATGISGLDDILGGGLTSRRLYLVEGPPGSGKTTLALQFLLEGRNKGEALLYITLSETREELIANAASHGWRIEDLDIVEVLATEAELQPENQYTMFQPNEMELVHTTRVILAEVERIKPKRVVIDSLSELRLLSQHTLRYRRQILALKQFFMARGCTVLLLNEEMDEESDIHVLSIAQGVISLQHLSPEYGSDRRRLRVKKMRGHTYRGGYHDFNIVTGGIDAFPRIVAAEHYGKTTRCAVTSGIEPLDALLGGGIDGGTSVLLVGPAGSGKSTIAVRYAYEAATRGERSALFVFDERREILLTRAAGLGMPLEKHLESGLITIQQVDPAEMSPGEFASRVRAAAEGADGHSPAKVLVIDSLNGYSNAMPEERFLTVQLHELLTYLGHKAVVTFLVLAQHGMFDDTQTPVDTSYLADTVILFRYFEFSGEVRQALSVVKKRDGQHERTIRELRLGPGIHVGEPVTQVIGVVSSSPRFPADGKVPRGGRP